MPTLAVVLAAVTAASTAACSIPEKQQYPPFGCNGQDLPVPDPVTIRGAVLDPVMNKAGVPDALVEVFVTDEHGATTLFTSKRSEHDGSFVITLRTATLRSMYLKVSKDSGNPANPYLDTYFYPPTALPTDDVDGTEVQLLTSGEANSLAGLLVAPPSTPPILLAITVVDCNQVSQGGATVFTDPKADAIGYLHDMDGQAVPDPTVHVTDRQEGTALGVLVPMPPTAVPAMLTVRATVPAPFDTSMILNLRSHAILTPKPGTLIQTVIQP